MIVALPGLFIGPSVFLFPVDSLNKYQWHFTKLGDIVQIWFVFGNTSGFLFPVITSIFGFSPNLVCAWIFRAHNFSKYHYISKYQYNSMKLALCTDIVVVYFGAGLGGSFGSSSTGDQVVAGSTPAEVGNILS